MPAIVRLYQSQMRENGKAINLSNFFLLCCNKSQHNLSSLYNDAFFLFPVFLTASFLLKPNRNYDFQKQKNIEKLKEHGNLSMATSILGVKIQQIRLIGKEYI